MAKKKKRQSKVQLAKPYILYFSVAIIVMIAIISIVLFPKSNKQDEKTKQTVSSTNESGATLDNPAVAEAKAAADKYFEALHICDLETANSLRFVPKDNIDVSNQDQCKKDCAGSPTFRFVKVTSYETEEVDGEQVEIAGLSYLFTCENTTRSTGVIMMRDEQEKKWLLFSTI